MSSNCNSNVQRMNWLDGARLAAAFCIIGIHTSSDTSGGAHAAEASYDRVFPVLLRSVSELASTEFFILISLFLLSLKLARSESPYVSTMLVQARRLLVPFVVWTVFYAFFRFYKGFFYGYEAGLLEQVSSIKAWLGYFLLGNVNFHMHFLPTLFLLLLFHRIYKLAVSTPALGLLIVPMLYLNLSINGWIWSVIDEPQIRDYLVRFIKVLTYTGYGFFAYSMYGLWQRGIKPAQARLWFALCIFFVGIGFIIKMIYAQKVGVNGEWVVRRDYIFYGHYLLPCAMLGAFMYSSFLNWPDKLARWSRFSFGMYLIHPAIMDVLDIALYGFNMQADWYVLVKYCTTAYLALCLTIALGRVRLLAWTVGLGPIPGIESQSSQEIVITQSNSENTVRTA